MSFEKPDDDRRRRTRADRIRWRAMGQRLAPRDRERLRWCGRKRTGPEVTLMLGARGASLAGLETCSSIHACPVCSAKIRTRRAEEIGVAFNRWSKRGGGGLLVTLTVKHAKSEKYEDVHERLAAGYAALRKNRAGRRLFESIGADFTIKAIEDTHGRHGWHPHLHLLLFTNSPLSPDARRAFELELRSVWTAYFADRDLPVPGLHGVDVREATSDGVAWYVAKVQDDTGKTGSLGLEMARGDVKTARRGGKTPFALLAEAATLDRDSRRFREITALWREYVDASHGRRAIVWSRGLKELLGVDQLTDEDLALEDVNEDAKPVLRLEGYTWRAVRDAQLVAELLDAAELDGQAGALTIIRIAVHRMQERAQAVFDEDDRLHGPPKWPDELVA